jgi:hypothetical protein
VPEPSCGIRTRRVLTPPSRPPARPPAPQVCKPKDFAGQINLEMGNCWGVVRAIVDLMLQMEEVRAAGGCAGRLRRAAGCVCR